MYVMGVFLLVFMCTTYVPDAFSILMSIVPLQPVLSIAISHHVDSGNEPGSSSRVARTLNHSAILPSPWLYLKYTIYLNRKSKRKYPNTYVKSKSAASK